jgi:plasmid stabilization system protein ParE
MTRLVVTADAETDTNDILEYLEREAGSRIAEDYGRRFRAAIVRSVDLRRQERDGRRLAKMSV